MSNYKLDVKGVITLGDYSSIDDYMEMISENDSLTITISEKNKDELEIVKSMLRHKNFLIDENSKKFSEKYFIRAYRNN